MKIMIIAGEASGDNHAAKVIEALRVKDSQVDCFGIGSTKMHEAGCRLFF
jgi:lipid A disaccharide synthetase